MKGNPTLPHELIVEILLRLPVRSLLRFKCVCKSWLSLISSDPQFAKSHFDLAASPTHRLVLNLTSDDGKKIKSLDLELSFHDDSSILNLNFPPPPPPNEYTIALSGGNNGIEILGSCRGFMLLSNHKGDLVVWNPATGFHRKISDFGYSYKDFLYGIGYDSSKDDYLIVFIQLVHKPNAIGWPTQILYFSLKTNSWSDPQLIEVQYTNIRKDFQPGSLLNETLHWSVISYDEKLDVIIAFDLKERSLFEIPLPHDLALELTYEYYHLRVMGGCLSICYSGGRGAMAEIWMMKEYKVQSSWTKSYVISTHDIPRNIFLPTCFTKCGGIFGSNGRGSLVKLNDKGELLEHCKYLREKGAYCLIHCGMYRESLLSLP